MKCVCRLHAVRFYLHCVEYICHQTCLAVKPMLISVFLSWTWQTNKMMILYSSISWIPLRNKTRSDIAHLSPQRHTIKRRLSSRGLHQFHARILAKPSLSFMFVRFSETCAIEIETLPVLKHKSITKDRLNKHSRTHFYSWNHMPVCLCICI